MRVLRGVKEYLSQRSDPDDNSKQPRWLEWAPAAIGFVGVAVGGFVTDSFWLRVAIALGVAAVLGTALRVALKRSGRLKG